MRLKARASSPIFVAALGEDLGAFAARAEPFGRTGRWCGAAGPCGASAEGHTEDGGDPGGGEDGRQQQQPRAFRGIGEGDDRPAERADDGQQEDRERDGDARNIKATRLAATASGALARPLARCG